MTITIEEALAVRPGHWHRGGCVAALNDAGDLLLIDRRATWEEDVDVEGAWVTVDKVVMEPIRVRKVTGDDDEKVAALIDFMAAGSRSGQAA